MLEFAVITTDKGEAIDIMRERDDATAVVFFGDDVTDEKAFRRLRDEPMSGSRWALATPRRGYRVSIALGLSPSALCSLVQAAPPEGLNRGPDPIARTLSRSFVRLSRTSPRI